MASRPPLSIQRTVMTAGNRPWATCSGYSTAAGCRFSSATLSLIQKRYHHGLMETSFGGRLSGDTLATAGLLSSSARAFRPACINVPRTSILNQVCRSYSILPKSIFDENVSAFRSFYHNRAASRRFHVSTPFRYDRLQNLEDAANRDRDNANAQAVFLQAQLPQFMFELSGIRRYWRSTRIM